MLSASNMIDASVPAVQAIAKVSPHTLPSLDKARITSCLYRTDSGVLRQADPRIESGTWLKFRREYWMAKDKENL